VNSNIQGLLPLTRVCGSCSPRLMVMTNHQSGGSGGARISRSPWIILRYHGRSLTPQWKVWWNAFKVPSNFPVYLKLKCSTWNWQRRLALTKRINVSWRRLWNCKVMNGSRRIWLSWSYKGKSSGGRGNATNTTSKIVDDREVVWNLQIFEKVMTNLIPNDPNMEKATSAVEDWMYCCNELY
jgi:hypothetical protein